MTVDITQEEMNILNLNGCNTQAVADDVRLRRLNGETDENIRKSYDNLLAELRPITKTNINDTANIQKYNQKGGIAPFEYGKRTQMEFDGTYKNIDKSANLSKFEQMLLNSPRNKTVAERLEQDKLKKEERENRIKNGNATFLDKIGSAMDNFGEQSYQAQKNNTELQSVDKRKTAIINEVINKENADKTQKIGFSEALANGFLSGGWVPFAGGYLEKADDKKQREIQEHILKGEPIRQDELDFLNNRIEKKKEEMVRGYTIGGSIGQSYLPSLIRFGSEMASGGWVLKSLGFTGAGAAAGAGTYKALRGINAGKKVALAGGKVTKGLTNMTVAGAVNTALPTTWNDTYEYYQERRLNKEFELTPDGRVYFRECDEKPAVTFMKSLGHTFLLFASEHAGELIGLPIKGATGAAQKYITSPISKYLKSDNALKAFVNKTIPQLSKAYEKMNNMPVKGKSLDWLKDKVKYDGFFEELGEEVVEDLLNITLGTGDEERTFENYLKAIKKSPDEWAILAGAVALQGGTLSVASHLLGSYMEKNGASDEVIIETLNNLKDDGIKEEVNKLVQNGEINVENFNLPENEQEARRQQVEETFYNKILKGNVSKDIALSNTKLFGQFFKNAISTEEGYKKFNKILQKLDFRYNIPANQNEAVLNQDKPKYHDRIEKLNERLKKLNLNNKSEYDRIEEFYEISKNELLEQKRNELENQGLSDADIREELNDLEGDWKFEHNIKENSKYSEWADNVEVYVYDYADLLAEYCEDKGYIVDVEKSKQSISTYLKLYETNEQFENNEPVKEIRISDHKNGYGDKDIMLHYSTPINDAIKAVDDNISNIISEEFINNFKGFVYDKSKIDKELDFINLTVPEIQTKIKNYYDKYLKSNSKSPYKKVFSKDEIGVLSFSRRLERNLTTKRDFETAQILLSNMAEIIDKGEVLTKSKTEKIISSPILFKDKKNLYKFDLPVNIDSNGNWIIDVNKIKISPDAVANSTRTFKADNNIIPDLDKNLNPSVNKHEDKGKTFFQKINKKGNASEQLGLFDGIMQLNLFKQEQIFEPQTENNNSVQTEIKNNYDIKDVQERQQNDNISDVGDSLLGNLKRNKKQYTWQELDTMNDLLRKKYLSKSYIYQLPSVDEFRKEGLSDNAIAYINLIYSKINAKPAKDYADKKENQKIYFDSVQDIMSKTIEFVKNNKEYFDTLSSGSKRNDDLFNIIFPDKENKNKYNIFISYTEYNKQAIITGGNKLIGAMQIGYSTRKDIEKFAALLSKETDEEKTDNKDTVTGWQKRLNVVNTYKGYVVADRKSGMMITEGLPTKEEAEKLAELIYNEINNNSANFTDNYELLRDYIPRRENNQNVKPEALIEVFGFRGVNFGNWTKQQERQDFINSAYDSLYDLAELLNLPPKALSLGGKLGLAFGAQGRKGAAGHFIPEYNEINLTRKQGAGALAHEWWHALDYYFGDQAEGKDFSGKVSLSLNQKGELREVIFDALKNIKEEMIYAPLTEEEIQNKSSYLEERAIRRIKYWAEDIKKTFEKSKNADKMNEFIDGLVSKAKTLDASDESINEKYISLIEERRKTWDNLSKITNLTFSIKNLQKVDEVAAASKKYTTYYENAAKLNDLEKGHGKGYWTSNTELGARAFSSYILNKMAEKNFKNNFLARSEQLEMSLNVLALSAKLQAAQKNEKYNGDEKTYIEWYPAEPEERKRIFAAFDNLFNNIQTKEQNGTTVLYQENDGIDENSLIAGYPATEVMDKLTELYEQQGDLYDAGDKDAVEKITAKINIITDALTFFYEPEGHSSEELQELAVNTYYIMNNQEIPDDYIDTEIKSQRTVRELIELHKEKKEKAQQEYYGYFKQTDDKNIITIMQSANASTALHELGHFYLIALNELAEVDTKARRMLDEVNRKLGSTNGNYTVDQQEKFARSFEAYLYNGKAPNNTLRQVFEQFKEWLKSVYHHVTDIEGAEVSEEMQELFDKIFGDDEYYEEKKQAKELLDKINKAARKEKVKKVEVYNDSQLDETQKRHKEVCYDILSAATGKSKVYLKTIFETDSNSKSMGKKREKIEELMDKVDDKIYNKGGFLPEWKEFFSDTGVSYENKDGGDYELAQQALDAIINKNYKRSLDDTDELTEKAEYFERAIDNANRQYKILLSSFKNENRNVALAAYYEWINSLPDEIKDDYESRFTYDVGLIERNEHVDKFDKAKRNIIAAALEVENQNSLPQNEKYKQVVMEIMKNLSFLQPEDKAKLTTNVLDIDSVSMLMASVDNILDIAKTMEDVNYRRRLEREIHQELQTTKNIKKNGRTVGKYNYKSNKIFEELRNLDRLSPETANEYRLENKRFADAEDNGISYKDRLINKFLSYKAGGRTFADTELMKELYDEIVKIKLAGKSAKSEQDLQEKLSEEKDIDELIKIIQSKKNAKVTTKAYINMFGNLESIINALFNKDIKERYASEILYDETQAQAWQYEQKKNFEEQVAKIYNLPQWLWDKKIIEYLNEKHTYNEYRRKYDKEGNVIKTRNINRELTKMDIIQAYIWSKNDILEKRLINQFGEDQLYNMFDELSIEDVKFAELMMRTAQSYYPMVNKAFIEKYGLDLPKVSCYFPSTPERGSEVDLYNDYSSKSLGNGFTKSRASSEILPMDFHNPVTTLYSHIEGVAKFTFMSKNLDTANIRFRNNDLKRAVIDKYGEDAYRSLEQSLINITYKKEAPVFNGYQKVLDSLASNWVQANVSIKPIVGLKQLLSANNYAVDMPYMKWQTGFLKAIASPKKTIDYMMSIPYLKARYGGSFSNEFLKQTIENSAFATTKKLKDLCSTFIKMGDIGAIIFGGKPYIDYLIKDKGMSEADAIKQFILSTNRSQQSSAVSSLSNFQVAATRNPIGRLFIAYKNSPQQYVRMCGDAIISATNGDISKVQAAKLLFQYGYLQPFLYAAATSGSLFRLLIAGDDDDLLKDLKISIFDFGSNAMPILGDIYKYAINRLVFKEKYVATTTPLLGDIENEIGKMAKDDVDAKDFFEALGYIIVHAGLGYNTKAITNELSGVGDIATGEGAKGTMKVLGYTNKRAERITQ